MRKILAAVVAVSALGALLVTPGASAQTARTIAPGVIAGDLGTASVRPKLVARRALNRHAAKLGVDASDFRFDSVRRSIVGTHVRGSEYRGGVPVQATSAAVHIVDGEIWQIEARPSSLPGGPSTETITQQEAIAAALAATGVASPTTQPRARRILIANSGTLVDVFQVNVFSLERAVVATVNVAAANGDIVSIEDSRRLARGTATVFDPNPVVRLKDNTIREPGVDQSGVDTDMDSEQLTKALSRLPLIGYDGNAVATGRLVGPWVEVQGPAPLGAPGETKFSFTRSDPRFETTMAYAHVDRLQRYFQGLGFTGKKGVNAEPQNVYTLPVLGFDNSFYSPGDDIMVMGAGGVDDGEDAEVIIHEYGHAVHDAQVPGWGEAAEGGAMGEGFGDFLAASFFATTSSGGFQDTCVADWDAVSYSDAKVPCLRRLDTRKQYPKDMQGAVHADGELWSAFLWKLRDSLGTTQAAKTKNVLTLVLTSHEFLTPTAEFKDAVNALKTAAKALGRPRWIRKVNRAAAYNNMPS